MKKLTALLLTLFTLASCTAKTEIDIAEGLETYRETYGAETEVPYTAPDLEKAIGGLSGASFSIQDGRYYFPIRKSIIVEVKTGPNPGKSRSSVATYAYADLKTGNYALICPDPLCTHASAEICKYYGFEQGAWFTEYTGVFYTYRQNHGLEIHRVDLQNDTARLAYAPEQMLANIIGYHDGKLYFYESLNYTEDKKTIRRRRLSCIDDSTGEITELGYFPDGSEIFPQFMKDGKIYYMEGKTLGRMDPDFGNREEILKTAYGLSHWIWDDNTGELYFSSVNEELLDGAIYRYADGAVEKLVLPHEDIYSFTLTNDKIYYSPYDPLFHGINILAAGDPALEASTRYHVYDYTGGKVYSVDRSNPSAEAELVYDNGGEFLVSNLNHPYVVFGDYLYMDEIELTREVINSREYVYYNSAFEVSKIRVGLKDGSYTKIKFE